MSWSGWYGARGFVDRLVRQYWFLPGYDYLWRYAQGDSVLTRRSVRLALQECSSAAAALSRLSDQLDLLVVEYENGELTRSEFEQRVEQKTKEIRKLAKQIRKDYFLNYLDQSKNKKVISFQQANSIAALRELTGELRMMARMMDSGISDFYAKNMTRVVEVGQLQQPSFDALSKQIDRLAKTITKSARRL
jgi:hypothetical protein